MPKVKKSATTLDYTTANLGFEVRLWAATDAPRGSRDAAEYKYIVFGLVFRRDHLWECGA
jgi:type I restriction enzyme M protein